MNPVYNRNFPDYVILYGQRLKVHCDFKDVIEIASMLSDSSVPLCIKPSLAMRMFFCDSPEQAAKKCSCGSDNEKFMTDCAQVMSDFLAGGCERPSHSGSIRGSGLNLPYDFNKDAELIYAAFMQTYGIDLAGENMHWWRFRALFKGLSKDTEFARIVGIRTVDISDVTDSKRRAALRRLKAKYSLTSNLSSDDKARIVGETLKL